MQKNQTTSVHLKEAEKLLDKEHYSKAYDEAKKALEAGEEKEKALFALGEAAYGMRNWEQSAHHYQELCDAFPENDDAQEGLLGAQARLEESRTGRYDFGKLYAAAVKGNKDINVADYVGPVKVTDIPGKGKGLVATEDVKKGTLLMLSKAFVVVDNAAGDSALPRAIAEKLKLCPEMADEIAALYDGSDRDPQKTASGDSLNLDRLLRICKYNCFSTEGFADLPQRYDAKHKTLRGLWILPSYFNHSCLRNAHRTYYGDVMSVFAISDIKKGDEITINYFGLLDSYQERVVHLKLGHGFICSCRLCELDKADPLYDAREDLVMKGLSQQNKAMWNPGGVAAALEEQLIKIRATYARRPELQTQLYSPLKSLGNIYQQALGAHSKAVKHFEEAAKCLHESILSLMGVRLYAQIADCYDHMRKTAMARKYARMALELHHMRSGADEKLFKKLYADIAHLI